MKDWIAEKMGGRRVTARLGSDQIKLGSDVMVSIMAMNGNDVLEASSDRASAMTGAIANLTCGSLVD